MKSFANVNARDLKDAAGKLQQAAKNGKTA